MLLRGLTFSSSPCIIKSNSCHTDLVLVFIKLRLYSVAIPVSIIIDFFFDFAELFSPQSLNISTYLSQSTVFPSYIIYMIIFDGSSILFITLLSPSILQSFLLYWGYCILCLSVSKHVSFKDF